MRTLAPREFAQAICAEVRKGYGFVPLLGSGISAPSGIPTGEQFGDYLCFCIEKALEGKWNPQNLDWPSFDGGRPDTNWIRDQMKILYKEGPTRDNRLIWQAVGALADWRASLQLLSRLRLTEGRPHLGAPNDLVIDSFLRYITRRREASIAHLMLAHLADALRIRTILTTNFDSLIEDAFARLGMPVETYDVHQKAGLPDTHLVLAQRSVVKLHGGKYGLRADFTLDEVPSADDCGDFAGYLVGASTSPEGQRHVPKSVATRNHLLVMGLSGTDERMLRLIEAARSTARGLEVFWIVHHATGAKKVRRLLPSRIRKWEHLTVMSHWNLDLFLLELYQRLLHSLPPPGANYPAFWQVPPHPYVFKKKGQKPLEAKLFDKYADDLHRRLKDLLKRAAERRPILLVDGPAGVSSVAADVYDRLQPYCHCVWLELDDFCGLQDLFVRLTECLARCRGIPALAPIAPLSDDVARVDALRRLVAPASRPFMVFLNGRDGPGSNAGWESGWTKTGAADPFWKFLRQVRRIRNSPLTFVVLTRSKRWKRRGMRGEAFEGPTGERSGFSKFSIPKGCIPAEDERIKKGVKRWLRLNGRARSREATHKRRFVYALTLFRHARHPAALCSWSLLKAPKQLRIDGGDNDEERAITGCNWLAKLETLGATRVKPGGFVWMHRDVKQNLRDTLEKAVPRLRKLRAECHQGIADWYAKLFRSSNDPLAALESVYHRLCCIDYAKQFGTEGLCGSVEHVQQTSFTEAVATLRLARRRILACGHFTASTNLMQAIADHALELAQEGNARAHQLWCLCCELQRDFAAGVTDFDTALRENMRIRSDEEQQRSSPPGSNPRVSSATGAMTSDGLRLLILEHREAHLLAGLRSYEAAEECFGEFFREIDLVLPLRPSVKKAVWKTRDKAREWLDGPRASEDALKETVTALRRYMFLEMLIAQIHGLCGKARKRRDTLQRAELVYVAATDLMRGVDDSGFLQRENAYIRTSYSVLLANMGRYYEARRRLNEARGYLAQSDMPSDAVAWAVVDLRRAEIHLRQVEALARRSRRPQSDSLQSWKDRARIRRALLEDAFEALERARCHLALRHSNIWWYTWMLELHLTLCSFLVVKKGGAKCRGGVTLRGNALACSTCPGVLKRCRDVIGEAVRVIQKDPLRQARLTNLVLDITKATACRGRSELIVQARKHLNQVIRNREQQEPVLDKRVGCYVETVLKDSRRRLTSCGRRG